MAVGSPLFRLLRANAVVAVEAAASNPTGGTVNTWAVVADGVDVLVTQAGGGRDYASGLMTDRNTYSVAGVDPSLGRPDVRLRVTAVGPGLAALDGRYLAVVSGVVHPAGAGGLLPPRVNLSCVVMETPADAGTAL